MTKTKLKTDSTVTEEHGTPIGSTGVRLYLDTNDLCDMEEATGQSTGEMMDRCSALDMRGIREVLRYGLRLDRVATVEEASKMLEQAGITACAKAIVAEVEASMKPRTPHPGR